MQPGAAATIVEVGPPMDSRASDPMIQTSHKIEMVTRLHAAGLRRMEARAFVNDRTLPQIADAAEVLAAARALPGLDVQVLVPNARYAERALSAGAQHLTFVVSVSNKHNINNVRVATEDLVWSFERMGIPTSMELDALLDVAEEGGSVPGALSSGRVRMPPRGACSRAVGPAV